MPSPALSSGHVRAEEHGPVLHAILDRADKLNALTHAMYQDLTRLVEHVGERQDLHVLLIRARGRAFCAGNDISDFINADPASRRDGTLSPAMVLVHALMALDKPVVMAVQGNATGIGTTMLLHADLVVAAEDARFHTAFINLGLVPEAGSSLLLPALIGRQNAARLLLAGDTFNAEEAQQMGLVAYREPVAALEETAAALASRLAEKPPAAMAMTKQLMRLSEQAIKAQIERESAMFAERMFSDDTRARFARFLKQ
ncbi:enoyl-CoA hydratase [Alcanivorax hongdengensis A-11-3]|uniref:Enoyl-CoA hydratase n=1 Tax=Alcanivorax hongdengensis A-11-3 TaxID=1177179 RepID=L0WFM2_9GAMM|nr:enoyl-CoA hydratase-related protein [Alcanivorax hongdengensis]EKF74932.1 enoyl-CoA hydratase [Alcanivorax hongdengensis A-11-3]